MLSNELDEILLNPKSPGHPECSLRLPGTCRPWRGGSRVGAGRFGVASLSPRDRPWRAPASDPSPRPATSGRSPTLFPPSRFISSAFSFSSSPSATPDPTSSSARPAGSCSPIEPALFGQSRVRPGGPARPGPPQSCSSESWPHDAARRGYRLGRKAHFWLVSFLANGMLG